MTSGDQKLQAIINYINCHVENPNPRLTVESLNDYNLFNPETNEIELHICVSNLIDWYTLSCAGLDPSDSMSWNQLHYSLNDSVLWKDWVETESLFYKKANLP